MWKHRNTIVHGTDAQHSAEIILQELRQQIQLLYQDYHDNPHIILPRHNYLFTSRTLTQRMKYSYDHLHCWICSVTEAKLMLQHHDQLLREQSSRHFFPIRSPSNRQPPESDSSQDSYSPSTHTLSDTSTTLYTTSTEEETMSDTDTTTTTSTHVSNSTSCSSNPPSTIQWIVM
jgi:hypothetical protein